MERTLITSYKSSISPSIPVLKDSITLPSNVREIRQICPFLSNGDNHEVRGFFSVNSENSNTTVLNNVRVNADKRHWNKKAIDLKMRPEGNNLGFVLNVEGVDRSQACYFMVLIKYVE